MDNKKRNIHNSGPLGMLMKAGQVKKIEDTPETVAIKEKPKQIGGSYFKTQSGIEFNESELMYLDPKKCEPWQYANRHENELGDMDELIGSIKESKQLQPALVRSHPTPHGDIEYEVIFGRRRHLACLQLGIPFLAIRKEITNIQDAIVSQDAENKFRNNVSYYSNAVLYKRLLRDGIFKTEKELASKLRLSPSTLNDLMVFVKIPADIVQKIPNIHTLSKSIALKIVQLINKSKKNHNKLLEVAAELGKSITSPGKLESIIEKPQVQSTKKGLIKTKQYKCQNGKKLFTFKVDHKGSPCVVLNKDIAKIIDISIFCESIKSELEAQVSESGAPDC